MNQAMNCEIKNDYFKKYFKHIFIKHKFNSVIDYVRKKIMKVNFMSYLICNKAESITLKVQYLYIFTKGMIFSYKSLYFLVGSKI